MTEDPHAQKPVPVIVHLSGARRGTTQRLRGDRLRIGTGPEVEVHVAHEPSVASHHATLVRNGSTYELETEEEHPVWINGKPEEHRVLASGDVLEIGRDGPLLRYRLYPPGSRAYKSPAEAFSDCVECARHGSTTPMGRAAFLLTGTPRELATQTSVKFRALMIFALLAVVLAVTLLARAYTRLENRVEQEALRLRGITEVLAESEKDLSREEIAAIRTELTTALTRVEALEARTDAPARVVAASSKSIVFLQGAYGFIDAGTRKPLRFAGIGPDGAPLIGLEGAPLVGLEGDGPRLEAMFTGTAFVATETGLLLTNRHVALPWAYDEGAQILFAQGLLPVMNRFIGYLPGIAEPFGVGLVLASDHSDMAVLAYESVTDGIAPLEMSKESPDAGDEVIVLGYPTGIRALLARADESFVAELASGMEMDFWSIAQRLSSAGHISPLASRGIVAQVNPTAVVYDAETTRGGSGGPVLDLDGRVLAVTSAIVPEFGGSNLAVPAIQGQLLLERAEALRMLPVLLR
jgi:serine protease Do